MTIRFERVPYGNPSARQYLQLSLDKNRKDKTTLNDLLSGGEIYLVFMNNEPVGAFYAEIVPMNSGNVLNIPALGGECIKAWVSQLKEFIINLLVKNGLSDVYLVTERGWGRIIPELEELGTLYFYRIPANS